MPFPDAQNETYRLEWWVNGTLLAEALTRETCDGFAYICTQCDHRTWAAKYFPNRALIRMYVTCGAHLPDRPTEVPGSLLLWYATEELERMPDVLVEREFTIHLAYYLQEIQREQTQSGDTRPAANPNPRIDTAGILAELEAGPGTPNLAGA